MYLALFFPTEIEASHYYSGICTLARIHRVFGYTKKAAEPEEFYCEIIEHVELHNNLDIAARSTGSDVCLPDADRQLFLRLGLFSWKNT